MANDVIALGADHAGFPLKEIVKAEVESLGYRTLDLGTHGPESVDYPDFGHAVADAISAGQASKAVVCCGTGIGISMAANRHSGVRAAVCHDVTSARLAREHNDANVLAIGARMVGSEVARDCLRVFLSTPFAGGRHGPRVEKIELTRE